LRVNGRASALHENKNPNPLSCACFHISRGKLASAEAAYSCSS
jgi:hypothetical protein